MKPKQSRATIVIACGLLIYLLLALGSQTASPEGTSLNKQTDRPTASVIENLSPCPEGLGGEQ